MAISILNTDDKSVTFAISDRFDRSTYRIFKNLCMQFCDHSYFSIDMSRTTYMDSSGLGLLLMLVKFANKNKGKVTLLNPNNSVIKILEMARADEQVTIVKSF